LGFSNLREDGVPKRVALRCTISVHGGIPALDSFVISKVQLRSGGKGFEAEDVDVVPSNSVPSAERVVSWCGFDSF
jgi:hypothetical protein